MSWVGAGARSLKIPLNHGFKLLEGTGFRTELPLEARAHLALHLVDLLKGEDPLADNAPGLV